MNRREFLLATLAGSLAGQLGCEVDPAPLLPARTSPALDTTGLTRLARFVQMSDTHVVDPLSPARFAEAYFVTHSVWRPYEAYAGHLADGIVRTINRVHASGRSIDFVLHTGDACDNAQSNELAWFLSILDGRPVNPLSGPDDRPVETRPESGLDPYLPYLPQGLYRQGVHGALPSIPWYALIGNHDTHCVGILPFFDQPWGGRTAPVPLQPRPGIVLPVVFDPEADLAYGNVTPAQPGPPPIFQLPRYVAPNRDRRFFHKVDFAAGLFSTQTGPLGHGLTDPAGPAWYSVSPAPGLRIIALDSADPPVKVPNVFYVEAAMTAAQVDFLRAELDAALARDEIVLVATHHPSGGLQFALGSAIGPDGFRALLAEYPNVVAHVCGHEHVNRVIDRGQYLEILTCATIDLPQEARLLEVYRDPRTGQASIAYEMISHLDAALPPLGYDPFISRREVARGIAQRDAGTPTGTARRKRFAPDVNDAERALDRSGIWRKPA